MAKADFTFYELPGFGEFVIPAPASDPYKGAYHHVAFGEMAIGQVVEAVSMQVEAEPTVEVVEASEEDMICHFFKSIAKRQDRTLIGQRISIQAQLPQDDGGYWSKTMIEIDSALYGLGKRRNLGPAINNGPLVLIESVDDLPLRLSDDEQPVNPSTRLRQLVLVDAFRWLPGPVRKSKTGQQLLPTFSPRPAKISIAQTIEVIGLNAELQAAA